MIAAWIALGWAGFSAGATAWALRPRARAPEGPIPATALLIRPCAGLEPGLLDRLLSVRGAACSARLGVVFALGSREDPAWPVAEQAAAALRAAGWAAEVVLGPPLGPNRKTSQLAAAARGSAAEALICADSDLDLRGLDLDRLLGPLGAGAAACWAPPVERGPVAGLGDRASQALLGGSLHSFPLLSRLDPAGLVGKLFAVRRADLAAIGGFEGLVAHLGEDMELARRLRAAGARVVVADLIAPSQATGRTVGAAVARYARWLQVIRAQRPALLLSYPVLFFCAPLQLLLVIGASVQAPGLAGAALGLVLLGRGAAALGAARRAGRPLGLGGALVDAILADGLLAAAWVRVLLTRRFAWRGVPLRIGPGGVLLPEG